MKPAVPLSEREAENEFMTVVVPIRLKPAFESFLRHRGLYLSAPMPITGEQDPDGEENRFIWPESMR